MNQPINYVAPVFPTPAGKQHNDDMTLRDYFAAAALRGLLAYDADCSSAIGLAYHTADAMLDWRKKNP